MMMRRDEAQSCRQTPIMSPCHGRHQSPSVHEQLGLDYAKSIGLSMRDPEFAGTLEIVCAFEGTLHSLMKIQTKTCIVVMMYRKPN